VKYGEILKQVFHLFGAGIHGSLTFTLKKYLRQTNGDLSNEKREQWETKAAKHMLCHNNNAERPFAVARAFNRLYPAITLYNLSHLSHSLVNGTHRPVHVFGRTSRNDRCNLKPPGIALTVATQARYYPRNTVIPVVIPKNSCFCQEGKTHRRVDIDL
jgi:hypothetical protein